MIAKNEQQKGNNSSQVNSTENKSEENKDIIKLLSSDNDYIELYKSNKEAAGLVAKILNKMQSKNKENNSENKEKSLGSSTESKNNNLVKDKYQ